MGAATPEPLLKEIGALGADAAGALRKRRERSAKALDTARAKAAEAQTAHGVAEERLRNSTSRLDAASAARDAALVEFPRGIAETHAEAHATLTSASTERARVKQEIETIAQRLESQRRKADAALKAARVVADKARKTAESAQQTLTDAISAHSLQLGRLDELRRARAAEDLNAAEGVLKAATERRVALPVPEQVVSEEEIASARTSADRVKAELAAAEREVQRSHGALEQVGGGVARDRLRDVTEAYDLADRHEREVEADCEAWRLLLEQMKLADAEQASNLGQVLGPAVAARFEALTNKRYDGVRIAADLGTEGVVVRGALRPTERVSVGTREQLSTLYRLSLAEYLGSTVVLDDQLVQSDEMRMEWFRSLLKDKARTFRSSSSRVGRTTTWRARPSWSVRGRILATRSAVSCARSISVERFSVGSRVGLRRSATECCELARHLRDRRPLASPESFQAFGGRSLEPTQYRALVGTPRA